MSRSKEIDYLPIGERKHRDQRYEVRPLLEDSGYILFSPVTIKDIHSRWINGIFDFYLPYEIGLENLKDVLVNWKRRYEKDIVYAVEKIFRSNGYNFIKTDLELCKIDKENNHPQYLGDYDVKVMLSRYKEVKFPIISFGELDSFIKEK